MCSLTPYIGVTGFMDQLQVRVILASLPPTQRKLMVGVLASYKSLNKIPNRWTNRFPDVNQIADIFIEDARALNLIHFNTDDRNTIDQQLARLIELGGEHLDGFQINMIWPDPDLLRRAFAQRDLRIVLQIGTNAYRHVQMSPQKLAERLDAYKELVTDILFDPSGGLGHELNADAGLPALRAVHERHPNIGLGIAGGLHAGSMHLIHAVAREFPHINIDAEGKIRDDADAPLNLHKTAAYIEAAVRELDPSAHASHA